MKLSPYEIAFVTRGLWTGDDWVTAIAVALAESGGDTEVMARSSDATSTNFGNWDHGLFQISGRWHATKGDGTAGRLKDAGSAWRDPFVNARLAREVFDETVKLGRVGWSAWAVYGSKAYEKYLPDARFAVKAPWSPPAS
jgi:hypothetical protein